MVIPDDATLQRYANAEPQNWPGGIRPVETMAQNDRNFLDAFAKLNAALDSKYPETPPAPVIVLGNIAEARAIISEISNNLGSTDADMLVRARAAFALNAQFGAHFIRHSNQIVFGEEAWNLLAPQERLAVIVHEWGHQYDPELQQLSAQYSLAARLGNHQAAHEIRHRMECRADHFVPPDLQPHLASALDKLDHNGNDITRALGVINRNISGSTSMDVHESTRQRIDDMRGELSAAGLTFSDDACPKAQSAFSNFRRRLDETARNEPPSR